MMFEQYNDVVTVEELAKMLRVGRSTAYTLVNSGVIPCIRVRRKIRISKQAIIQYLSETKEQSKEPFD